MSEMNCSESSASSDASKPSAIIKTLEAEGWQTQFSASGDRLREMIDNYEMMGLEVKTLPYTEAVCGACTECFTPDDSDPTMMILTRKARPSSA